MRLVKLRPVSDQFHELSGRSIFRSFSIFFSYDIEAFDFTAFKLRHHAS